MFVYGHETVNGLAHESAYMYVRVCVYVKDVTDWEWIDIVISIDIYWFIPVSILKILTVIDSVIVCTMTESLDTNFVSGTFGFDYNQAVSIFMHTFNFKFRLSVRCVEETRRDRRDELWELT